MIYALGVTAVSFALTTLVALARSVPGYLFAPAHEGAADVSETLARAMLGTAWLLPITVAGAVVAGIVSRTENMRPQTGLFVVGLGAAVGAVLATQLMPPPGVPSHDLAAWAVIAPAVALLVAVLPWPGALVHADRGTDGGAAPGTDVETDTVGADVDGPA
jgi:hypothetical protein